MVQQFRQTILVCQIIHTYLTIVVVISKDYKHLPIKMIFKIIINKKIIKIRIRLILQSQCKIKIILYIIKIPKILIHNCN